MPLVHECSRPGCSTLTMGSFCLDHELPPAPPLPRTRRLAAAAFAAAVAGFAAVLLARTRLL